MSFIVLNNWQGKRGHIGFLLNLTKSKRGHRSKARVGVGVGVGWDWGCSRKPGDERKRGKLWVDKSNFIYSREGNGLWSQGCICTESHKVGALPGMTHSSLTDYTGGHMSRWLTLGSRISCACHLYLIPGIYKDVLLFQPLCGPRGLQFPSPVFQSFSSL